MLNQMIDCLQRGAFTELANLGHNLKGSSGLAGYPDLAAKAVQIQDSAAGERADDLVAIIAEVAQLCRLVGASVDNAYCDALPGRAATARSELNSRSPNGGKIDVPEAQKPADQLPDEPKRQERGTNA